MSTELAERARAYIAAANKRQDASARSARAEELRDISHALIGLGNDELVGGQTSEVPAAGGDRRGDDRAASADDVEEARRKVRGSTRRTPLARPICRRAATAAVERVSRG